VPNNNNELKEEKELRRLWISFRLQGDLKEIKKAVSSIDSIVSSAKEGKKVRARQFELKERFPPYKYAIIDLEGDAPKLFGLVISNQVYQIFVTDENYLLNLYEVVWKILNELIDFYLFTFSNYETRFLKEILPFKLKEARDKTFFQFLKIVNIQRRDFEGLVPALYSLNESFYRDPLLRDSKKIELHFKKKNYHLILEHNKSCLLSTLKIVRKRYLKLNLI